MHGQVSDDDRDLSSVRSRPPILSILLAMGVTAIFADLALGGILLRVDEVVAGIWEFRGPKQYPIADRFDPIGQRLVCLPILFGVAFWLCRRLSSVRPLVIALGGTLLLNLIVGLVKIATERESPRTGGPELFAGDNVLFPSGHTANVVFVYGLTAALLIRYGSVSRRTARLLVLAVAVLFWVMTAISVYRHTHWFSDLIAGGMVAGAVLELTLRVDSEWTVVRGWLKRLAGPGWSVVELVVGRVRPVVVRDGGGPTRRPSSNPPRTGESARGRVSTGEAVQGKGRASVEAGDGRASPGEGARGGRRPREGAEGKGRTSLEGEHRAAFDLVAWPGVLESEPEPTGGRRA